jgi:hypothetical protein
MTAILILSLLAQSKAADKAVDEAIVAFGKGFAGPEEKKIEAIEKLRGLYHERVFAELQKCLNAKESPVVRAKAIEVLGENDHPNVAKILADSVKSNAETKQVLRAIVKSLPKCNWDIIHQALCEPLLMSTQNQKTSSDKEFGEIGWEYLGLVEKDAPIAAVDGLLKLLAKYEESRRAGYGTGDWYKKVLACLKACTQSDKESSKDIAAFWKSAKTANAGNFVYSYWCPSSLKRWDKKGGDAKAFCPHHGDKEQAKKDASVPALTKNH